MQAIIDDHRFVGIFTGKFSHEIVAFLIHIQMFVPSVKELNMKFDEVNMWSYLGH